MPAAAASAKPPPPWTAKIKLTCTDTNNVTSASGGYDITEHDRKTHTLTLLVVFTIKTDYNGDIMSDKILSVTGGGGANIDDQGQSTELIGSAESSEMLTGPLDLSQCHPFIKIYPALHAMQVSLGTLIFHVTGTKHYVGHVNDSPIATPAQDQSITDQEDDFPDGGDELILTGSYKPGGYSFSKISTSNSQNGDETIVTSTSVVMGPGKVCTGDPSGIQWCDRFPGSKDIPDLDPAGFQGDVQRFVDALEKGGATVKISATYRPPERAYLMHWAWDITTGHQFVNPKTGQKIGRPVKIDPRKVPAMAGVDICWVHTNAAGAQDIPASIQAAQAMVTGYKETHEASLTSRHIYGHAIDMSITWNGVLRILNAQHHVVVIANGPRDGTNLRLVQVGQTYGVIKGNFKDSPDAPHWSNDGH